MQSRNWSELMETAKKSGGGDPLPDGDYTVQCVEAKIEISKTSPPKPMIKCRCKAVGGPYDGRTVWNQFVISEGNPTALEIFFRHMACFGLTAEWFNTDPTEEQVAEALVGRTAIFTLGTRDYNGRKTNNVKQVKVASTGVVASAPVVTPPIPQPAAAGAVPPAPPAAPVPVPPPVPAPAPAPAPAPVPVAPPAPAPIPATPPPPPVPAPAAVGPDGVPVPPASPF